jgi:ribonuclease HI
VKVYFDGGCLPNPGRIETAVVAAGRTHHRADHGYGDNNDAEWLALIEALNVVRDLCVSDVILLGDSATVVDHVSGASRRVAPRFREYHARFQTLAAGFDRVRIRRVPRTQNLAGIALERLRSKIRTQRKDRKL